MYQSIIQTILAASEALRLQHLDQDAIPRLQQTMGAMASSFFRIDEEGELIPLGGSYVNDMPTYFSEFRKKDLIWNSILEADPRLTVFLPLRTIGVERFQQHAMYHEFYRHYHNEDFCLLRFTDPPFGTPGTTGVMLFRSSQEPPFSVRDVRIAQQLLPAFAAAVHRCEQFSSVENQVLGLKGLIDQMVSQPCLAFDERGRPLWISLQARRILGPYFDPKKHLPESLAFAVRHLAAAADGKTTERPQTTLTVTLSDGRSVGASLAFHHSPEGRPVVAVLLEERPIRRLSPTDPFRSLTPAEFKVTELLALGLSNEGMARSLFVSVETIKTHVKHILAKLDVRSRAEAICHILQRFPR